MIRTLTLSLTLLSILFAPALFATAELDSYRDALRAWAEGDTERAVFTVVELEDAALNGGSREKKRLRAAQKQTLQFLVGQDPETLVPVVLLHLAAWEHDMRLRDLSRVRLHRENATSIIETFAATQSPPESSPENTREAEASWLLTRVSESAFAYGAASIAYPLLIRALELDPTNSLAYLGMGYLEELSARRPEAVRYYARAAPTHAESRLRLAVCLVRLGRPVEARPILLEVARSNPSTWLAPVAWQELGRSYLVLEDFPGARDALTLAASSNSDPRIKVMLAYALERTGAAEDAQELLNQPPNEEEQGSIQNETEARDQYNRAPRLTPDPITAARIDRWMAGLRERLVAALDASGAQS